MNFPGHKYLGPGNSSHQGTPVDNDDAIALEHDLAYDDAKTEKDVRVADRKAIKHFTGDLVTTGNWHSAVGAAGLTAKYSVESVTGVVYPIVEPSPEGADNEAGLIEEGTKVVKEKVDVIIEPVRDFKALPTEKKFDSAVRVTGSATKFTAEKISAVISSHSDNKDDSSDSPPEKENLESNEESEGHTIVGKGKKVVKKKLEELAEPILGDKNLSTPEKLENAVLAAGAATKYTAGVLKGVISPLIHKEDNSGSSPEK